MDAYLRMLLNCQSSLPNQTILNNIPLLLNSLSCTSNSLPNPPQITNPSISSNVAPPSQKCNIEEQLRGNIKLALMSSIPVEKMAQIHCTAVIKVGTEMTYTVCLDETLNESDWLQYSQMKPSNSISNIQLNANYNSLLNVAGNNVGVQQLITNQLSQNQAFNAHNGSISSSDNGSFETKLQPTCYQAPNNPNNLPSTDASQNVSNAITLLMNFMNGSSLTSGSPQQNTVLQDPGDTSSPSKDNSIATTPVEIINSALPGPPMTPSQSDEVKIKIPSESTRTSVNHTLPPKFLEMHSSKRRKSLIPTRLHKKFLVDYIEAANVGCNATDLLPLSTNMKEETVNDPAANSSDSNQQQRTPNKTTTPSSSLLDNIKLTSSMRRSMSTKTFRCNQCKKPFPSLNSLCDHTTLVHGTFKCTICESKFTQRSNLQRHALKHVGFKPFECTICGKSYYRKDHSIRHVEVSHSMCEPRQSIKCYLTSSQCLDYLEGIQKIVETEPDSIMDTSDDNQNERFEVSMSPEESLASSHEEIKLVI